jgi:acyl dehydratase
MTLHDAREERFGRVFEDLAPGDRFRHWPGKTVTEADDHLFCLLTMAASPLHLDAHYAAEEMTDKRNIVLGTYIYALVLGMSVPDISGSALASLGVERMAHLAPVHHGDTLYAWTEVLSARRSKSRTDAGIVEVQTWGVNQDDERVIEFNRTIMVPCREKAE